MYEWLDPVSADLHLGTKKVREQISLNISVYPKRKRGVGSDIKPSVVAAISLQIHFDAEVLINIDVQRPATTIEAVSFRKRRARSVASIGVVCTYFELRELLCPCGEPE